MQSNEQTELTWKMWTDSEMGSWWGEGRQGLVCGGIEAREGWRYSCSPNPDPGSKAWSEPRDQRTRGSHGQEQIAQRKHRAKLPFLSLFVRCRPSGDCTLPAHTGRDRLSRLTLMKRLIFPRNTLTGTARSDVSPATWAPLRLVNFTHKIKHRTTQCYG